MSKKQKQKIYKLINDARDRYQSKCDQVKAQMLNIDLVYHRSTMDYMKACNENKEQGCHVSNDESTDITPPVLLSQTKTVAAYLNDTLLDPYKPFPLQYEPEHRIEGEKIELALNTDHIAASTYLNASQELLNTVKHNIGFHRIFWEGTDVLQAGTRVFGLDTQGLKVQTLSGYYCIWDTETLPKDFANEGMYFEHTQIFSNQKAQYILSGLKNSEHLLEGAKELMSTLNEATEFSKMVGIVDGLLSMQMQEPTSNQDYSDMLGDAASVQGKGTKITRINIRATEKMVGKKSRPGPDDIRERYNLYEIIEVNGNPVYLREIDAPYMEFGFTLGSIDDYGWNTKSIVEPLITYQSVAGKLLGARIKTLDRAVEDRAIYHPLYIDPEALAEAKSNSKVPIRRNKWGDPDAIARAYKRIPFEDRTSEGAMQDANYYTTVVANSATGVNAFRQAPVKGNRTQEQFQTENQAADGRGRLLAYTIEASRGLHLRSMARVLLLTHKPGDFDWSKIAKSLKFRVISRLRNLDLLDDLNFVSDVMVAGAQNQSVEDLSAEILEYVVSRRTDFDVEDFRRRRDEAAQNPELPALEGNQGGDGISQADQDLQDQQIIT